MGPGQTRAGQCARAEAGGGKAEGQKQEAAQGCQRQDAIHEAVGWGGQVAAQERGGSLTSLAWSPIRLVAAADALRRLRLRSNPRRGVSPGSC